MRIAVVLSSPSADIGGGYTFETDLVQALFAIHRESAHKFAIVCEPSAADALRTLASGTGVPVHPIKASRFRRKIASLLALSALARARWKGRTPIDEAADEFDAGVIWFPAAGVQFTHRPYITVVWDLQHRITPWFPEMSAAGDWDRRELTFAWFIQRASKVITGTSIGVAELERYYRLPANRIVVLPHPTPRFALSAGKTAVDVRRRFGLKRDFLLYPAQFWAHKNHVNLLHALQAVNASSEKGIDLVLVGSDKGTQSHVERTAESLGLKNFVHFPGFVTLDELIGLYREALAVSYVSWCGPENLPPLEAFALGCPVIATRIPGAEEQLGDAALFADPGDPDDIARAIMKLRTDSEVRRALIEKGLTRARSWAPEDYLRGVFKILDEFEPILRNWRTE